MCLASEMRAARRRSTSGGKKGKKKVKGHGERKRTGKELNRASLRKKGRKARAKKKTLCHEKGGGGVPSAGLSRSLRDKN